VPVVPDVRVFDAVSSIGELSVVEYIAPLSVIEPPPSLVTLISTTKDDEDALTTDVVVTRGALS
jgi:hypothetical protein